MLILTRRDGESIQINDDIRIEVLRIDKGNVRIGIDAPKSIPVHRLEIYEKIALEKTANSINKKKKES